MQDSPLIFLSHSSQNAALATVLSEEIEKEFSVTVFTSSRPHAIPSGTAWLEEVLKNLDLAVALVTLLTHSSENSAWVGFELGYFWKKTARRGLYGLYHPQAQIPSPFNTLQAKLVLDPGQVENFLLQLSEQLNHDFRGKANVARIVEEANKLTLTPAERSMKRFEQHIEDVHDWTFEVIGEERIWVYVEDALFQIVIGEGESVNYVEPWTEGFPDSQHNRGYPVYLRLAGINVKEVRFVSLDGGRYFVPMPELKLVNEEAHFFYRRDSLRFKLSRIIGNYYSFCDSLEEFAEWRGIDVID